MKILTLLVLASFTFNAFALPTGDATRGAVRTKLQADQTKVSTATGQAYFDCSGVGIPNESTSLQAYSLACTSMARQLEATPVAATAPTVETAVTTTARTYSTVSAASVGVPQYTEAVAAPRN